MKAVSLSLSAASKPGSVLSVENLFSGNSLQHGLALTIVFTVVGMLLIFGMVKYRNLLRKRRSDRGFMTIRQYYQYKSAR